MNQIRLFSRSSNSGSSSPAPSIGKTSMGGSASNLLQRLAPALSRRTESDKAISISSAPALNGKRSNSTSAGSIAEASSEDSGSSLTSPSKEDSSDVEAPQRSESPPPPAKKDSPPDSASPSAKRKRSASTAPSVSKPLSSSGEIPAPGSPSAQPSPSKATLRAKALLGKAAGDLKSEKKVRRLSARPGADTDDDE
jgi:hypothetical protein